MSPQAGAAAGRFLVWEGEPFYAIQNFDRMAPFFFSVVSAEDHWMFMSSHGGLTAGRKDADHALFPYATDDKIRDQAEVSGGKTVLRVFHQGREKVWEPLSARGNGRFRIQRTLLKSVWGNQVVFEERNADLRLVFRTGWFNSRHFGWIRRSWLHNEAPNSVRVTVLDGIQNLMPAGAGSEFQSRFSTLLDAYKRSELLPGGRLAVFRLSALPADRPEPAESLAATVAWALAPDAAGVLLSSSQLEAFRSGEPLRKETDVCGQRGAYFVHGEKNLGAGKSIEWMIGADVDQSAADVIRLGHLLRQPARFRRQVLAEIREGTAELRRLVGSADGLQASALGMGSARHYGNTLCNVMRGGVFLDGDRIGREDLDRFVRSTVPAAASRWGRWSRTLPKVLTYPGLIRSVQELQDPVLETVCREYLPLTFSRRHGDPSRPWNRFQIPSRDSAGRRILNYEGNWRDIFQNWEALAQSYPGFTLGMVTRFLNATTADGYNPYRITRDGIDWEVPDPHDPWACIGYWGDHQIIYLLKLLEHAQRHEPRELASLLDREIYTFANVPYRIRNHRSLVANPKDTVTFDFPLDAVIRSRVRARGAEGKMLWDRQGCVIRANLAEKLLLPLLAKLSNFVPGAGIWLNTQRPEWNDANNALVGYGTSVVTLAYLRRYLTFLHGLFSSCPQDHVRISADGAAFLAGVEAVLRKKQSLLSRRISDRERQRVMDLLGACGEKFRKKLYANRLSRKRISLSREKLLAFLGRALAWTDHSLKHNRRPDGLYHAYNLISFPGTGGVPLRRLYEMLEGQVAILSSGLVTPHEAVSLLRSLRKSAMYRRDQHSYLLYPNRILPRFLERNRIAPADLRRCKIFGLLLRDGDCRLVERDVKGQVHFRPGIANRRDLERILDQLAQHPPYRIWLERERETVCRIYEKLFDHQSFTGRSGTFYGYEGLGCIYWHMVSKLLLAVQELFFRAEKEGAKAAVRKALARAYYDIRGGLGDSKTPIEYGAFPMDPYSHTPAHAGAKQPGLTGQVKEDILCRWGELGIHVEQGKIMIRPSLLRRAEFSSKPGRFAYVDLQGQERILDLPEKSLAFTFCQTPFVYGLGRENHLTVFWADGTRTISRKPTLDAGVSRAVSRRSGLISKIEVTLRPKSLL